MNWLKALWHNPRVPSDAAPPQQEPTATPRSEPDWPAPSLDSASSSPATHANAPEGPFPESIGDYRIIQRLGGSKSAAVYEVEHGNPSSPRSLRRYALKVLANDDAEFYQRFKREIVIGIGLAHRNICRVVDWGIEGDHPYLVMELLQGKVLSSAVAAEGCFTVERAVQVSLAILNGLDAAHTAGVVHRDLNPSNVFLTGEGEVKVMDFGLARQAGGFTLTLPGQALGTVGFASPEQMMDTRKVSPRSDLFSTGLLFYFMLSGHLPTEANSVHESVIRLCQGNLTPLSDHRYDVSHSVLAWLDGMLAMEPEARPALARAAAAGLQAALSNAS